MKKIFIIMLVTLFISCSKEIKDTETLSRVDNYKISLVAVGDNLIHEPIYVSAKTDDTYDFKSMFHNVKPYIEQFDLAFINQETILGGSDIGLSTYPRFNSPYELGDALIDTGFDLVSIANNHTLDRGEIGVLNALNYLENQNLIYSGAKISTKESNVKTFTKNNINFAFVAYTYGTNGIPFPEGKEYLANVFSEEKARNDLNEIKNEVDVVIVSMHWGEQYQDLPNNIQIEQAEFLSSQGVDIILGHHPHVIQPVDVIESGDNKTFVVYSLGNFLSDQIGIDRLIGMAVSMDIVKTVSNDKQTITLENIKSKLTYTYKYEDEFSILFFESINENILPNHSKYFIEKKDLIRTFFEDIDVK
ncbi:CapA family protein [Mycoplasmatota bacterium WC44]